MAGTTSRNAPRKKDRKNPLMTVEQMAAEMESKKTPAQAARDESLKTDIAMARAALNAVFERGGVDLGDPIEVKARITEYFQACEIANSYPSIIGISVKALCTEPVRVREYIKRYPDSESARLIEAARQTVSDIIINQSLKGNAQPVAAIFQLKNWYDHQDKVTYAPADRTNEKIDRDEIKKRYGVEVVEVQEAEFVEIKEDSPKE